MPDTDCCRASSRNRKPHRPRPLRPPLGWRSAPAPRHGTWAVPAARALLPHENPLGSFLKRSQQWGLPSACARDTAEGKREKHGIRGHACVLSSERKRRQEPAQLTDARRRLRPQLEAGSPRHPHEIPHEIPHESGSRASGEGQKTVWKLPVCTKARSCSVFASSSRALLHCLVSMGERGDSCGADCHVSFAQRRALAKYLLSCLTRHCFYKLNDGL